MDGINSNGYSLAVAAAAAPACVPLTEGGRDHQVQPRHADHAADEHVANGLDDEEHHMDHCEDALPVRRRSRKPSNPVAAYNEPLPLLPAPAPVRTQQRAQRARRSDPADDADDADYTPRRNHSHARGSGGGDEGAGHGSGANHGSGGKSARGGSKARPAVIGSRLLSQRAVASKAAAAAAPAGTSGYFGVSWSKNKQRWDACFRACDVKLFRRNYHTAEEAARAWDLAAREWCSSRGPFREAVTAGGVGGERALPAWRMAAARGGKAQGAWRMAGAVSRAAYAVASAVAGP